MLIISTRCFSSNTAEVKPANNPDSKVAFNGVWKVEFTWVVELCITTSGQEVIYSLPAPSDRLGHDLTLYVVLKGVAMEL